MSQSDDQTASAPAPPFGLSSALPVFGRATELTKALFGVFNGAVVLYDGERVW